MFTYFIHNLLHTNFGEMSDVLHIVTIKYTEASSDGL